MGNVAVLLPGAGSSADFLRRAFGPALRSAGYELVAVSPAPGPDVVTGLYAALDAAAAEHGPALRLVGGVSLGAHVATRWAAALPPPAHLQQVRPAAAPGSTAPGSTAPGSAAATGADPTGAAGGRGTGASGLVGVLAALPAWTGVPGPVAAATAASAATVERVGTAAALERAAAGPGAVRWVADELAAAWPAYGTRLAASLRAAAAADGPTPAELAALRVPVGVVAFTDDPMHPVAVAQEWVRVIPRGGLARLRLADLGADRAVLGTAAVAAWTQATEEMVG
jgi:pimeloyl-ACP methyl ester carboxylesterase